jgi:DNA-binding transcriptional regulator YiaG
MTHGRGTRTAANGCNPRQATGIDGLQWSDIRKALGLSIRDMAEATGINRGDLSKIEHGRACPTPKQAARILALSRPAPE